MRRAPLATMLCSAALCTAGAADSADPWQQLAGGQLAAAATTFESRLAERPGAMAEAIGLAELKHQTGDPDGSYAVLIRALEANPLDPLAPAAVAGIGGLLPELADDGAEGIAVLERVERSAANLDPELRSQIQLTLADLTMRGGQADRAYALIAERAGRLRRFTLLGPFDRFDRLSFDRSYPPESAERTPDTVETPAGGREPLRVDTESADGRIVLPAALRSPGAVYAVAELELAEPVDARLRVTCTAAFKLFIDGRLALVIDRYRERPARTAAARVRWAAGRHRVMLKLPGGSDASAFSVDLHHADGRGAIPFKQVPVSSAALAGSSFEAWPDAIDARVIDAARSTPGHAIAAWWWLRARGLDEAAGSVLREATTLWQDNPLLQVAEGEFYVRAETGAAPHEDLALARRRFDSVFGAEPDLVRAGFWLAKMDAGAEQVDDAWRRLDAILARRPDYLVALRLQHELAARRGWIAEASARIERCLAIAPSSPEVMAAAVEFFRTSGAVARIPPLLRDLAGRRINDDRWAEFLTESGRTDEAIAEWRRLLALQPTRAYWWEQLARTLVDGGRLEESLTVLTQAEEALPREPWVNALRSTALAMLGRSAQAADALRQVVALAPERLETRNVLQRLGDDDPLIAHLADARRIISGAGPPPRGVDSTLLADIAAVLIDDGGGQTELYQGIHGVYTRAGVEHEGELEILAGARVDSIRLHKKDARVIDVRAGGKRPVSLPGLEPGDSIEYVWRRYLRPLPGLPAALDNQSMFVFQAADREYELSRYVVVHPAELAVAACGRWDGLQISDRIVSGLRVRSFTARDMPRLRLEPHLADLLEITPHVRLGMNLSWQDLGDMFRESLLGNLRPIDPLPELAAEVRKTARSNDPLDLAKALHLTVQRRIKPGGSSLVLGSPASAFASTGEGNRAGIVLALARMLGFSPRLVFGRPLEQRGLRLDCPTPGLFGYALVELALPGERLVYLDYTDADLPFDSIPARLSGSDALRVPLDAEQPIEIIDLPGFEPGIDQELQATVTLDSQGKTSGALVVELRRTPASATRRLLAQISGDRLPVVFHSVASSVFQDADVLDAGIEGLDDPESSLVIRLRIAGGGWSRRTALGFALPVTVQPLGLTAEYAPLESRRYPLLLDTNGYRRERTRLELPDGLEVSSLPVPVRLESRFGSYELSASVDAGALVVERVVRIPPQRIEAERYSEFREFARTIDDAERREIQLAVASPALAR